MADYYKTLEIDKGASSDAIKKAYRKLALKYHPDRNKGDQAAEEKFKEISEAYAVLSDDGKRQQYDRFGDTKFHQQYSQEDIFRGADFGSIFQEFNLGGMDSIFGRMFTGGGAAGFGGFGGMGGGHPGRRGHHAAKGQDVEVGLNIGFHEAFAGGERTLNLAIPGVGDCTFKVRIPKGARDGGRLRLAGKGPASPMGGPAGDLIVVLSVAPHPTLKRVDDDIECPVPLKLSEALLGTSRDVETLDGTKKVKIPAGVKPGTRVRLKGLGFPHPGKESRGDFYVVVELEIPKTLTQAQRHAAEALADANL